MHALVGIYFSQAYQRRQSLGTVDNIMAYEKCHTVLKVLLCSARLQAVSQAKPGPNRPSWAGPASGPLAAYGPA